MIKALIVDDEALAREGIRIRLNKEPDIEIAGEAADGPSAVKAIRKLTPDLVFLDVQMPGLDGFQILERISSDRVPAIIFVTAYDQHAVKAFEAQALDYLLKPISSKRFQEALRRARVELAREEAFGKTHSYRPTQESPAHMLRLTVKDRDRFLLLKTEEVDWIESAANYVQLHARGRFFLLRMTMNEIEDKLDGLRFARIHRSTIVNIDQVREIKPTWHGDFEVILQDGTALRLSRSYRDHLLPS